MLLQLCDSLGAEPARYWTGVAECKQYFSGPSCEEELVVWGEKSIWGCLHTAKKLESGRCPYLDRLAFLKVFNNQLLIKPSCLTSEKKLKRSRKKKERKILRT